MILNRYTIFYVLYVFYLIGGSLPEQYTIVPFPYYYPETLLAKFLIGLFFVLPVYFLIIEVWDLLLKRYKIALINLFMVVFLFIGYQIIARKVLKPRYQEQNHSAIFFITELKLENV